MIVLIFAVAFEIIGDISKIFIVNPKKYEFRKHCALCVIALVIIVFRLKGYG